MDTRKMFLRGLAADEDDEQLRLAFADWLDEQGETDEAERQRAWTTAKAWIFRLCEAYPEYDYSFDYDNVYDDQPFSTNAVYKDLMARAWESAARNSSYILNGGNPQLNVAVNTMSAEFWKNWSIVTGKTRPTEEADEDDDFDADCCY